MKIIASIIAFAMILLVPPANAEAQTKKQKATVGCIPCDVWCKKYGSTFNCTVTLCGRMAMARDKAAVHMGTAAPCK